MIGHPISLKLLKLLIFLSPLAIFLIYYMLMLYELHCNVLNQILGRDRGLCHVKNLLTFLEFLLMWTGKSWKLLQFDLAALRYLSSSLLIHETKDTAMRSLGSLSKKRPEEGEWVRKHSRKQSAILLSYVMVCRGLRIIWKLCNQLLAVILCRSPHWSLNSCQ